jgi:hypothetical protein
MALLPAGCEDSPTILPVDSVVELRLSESAGRLTILAETQRDYECQGYQITHRQYMRGNAFGQLFQIDMLGVRPPGPSCAAVLAPATATPSFVMPQVGRHSVVVTANGVATSAILEVTADSLIVTGGNGTWTLWTEPRVARP